MDKIQQEIRRVISVGYCLKELVEIIIYKGCPSIKTRVLERKSYYVF